MNYLKSSLVFLAGAIAAVGIQFLPAFYIGNGITANAAIGFGFLIGVFSGGLGMGGVWLMVPLMVLLFGTGIKFAIGTALTAQVVITLVGSYKQISEKKTGLKISIPLLIGGIIGTPIGVYLNVISPNTLLQWMYSGLLAVIGIKMGYEMFRVDGAAGKTTGRNLSKEIIGEKAAKKVEMGVDKMAKTIIQDVKGMGNFINDGNRTVKDKLGEGISKAADAGEKVREEIPEEIEDEYDGEKYRVDTLSLFIAGIIFGMINSLLGTSSTIVVPFLDVFMMLRTHVATVTSLINVTGVSMPASLNHMFVGNVMYSLAGFIALGGVFGSLAGSDINEIAPERYIQYAVILLLIGMSYYMLPVKPI